MSDKDIQFQAPVEVMLAWILARRCGGMVLPNQKGKDVQKDFTILVPRRVEVKTDYKSKATGNLYFEVYNPYRGTDSGLTATTAHVWIQYVPGLAKAFKFEPKRMLGWLKGQRDYPLLTKNGDNNSDGYVVPTTVVAGLPFVEVLDVML